MAYCVYGLIDLNTGALRYIGKTSRTLEIRLAEHKALANSKSKKRTHCISWIRSIDAHVDIVDIDCHATSDEELAELERFWIAYFMCLGAPLTNETKGGEGQFGYVWSRERRESFSGRISGDQNPFYGRTHTEETRAKMSSASKGKPKSAQHRANIAAGKLGKELSEETKSKISQARKGKPSPNKGRPMSNEHKLKLRESALRRILSLKGEF